MSVPPTFDLEGLLAEDQWMRRLARKLAGDAHAAEDLVQDTLVAALDAREETPRPRVLRSWLRGVLRNLWVDGQRTSAARARREAVAARAEALQPAGELVAELELRRTVADALLALEEPYRSALYLRFFKDQSLASIARRQGVAVTSAHERVQQGLARLRARLDREHGRSGAWGLALLSLAKPASAWSAAAEAMAMAGGLKLAASVLVIGGGVAWWWVRQESPPRAPHLAAPLAEAAPPSTASAIVPVEAPSARLELRAPASDAAAPAPVADEAHAPLLVHGRVVDPYGGAVGSVEVGWADAAAETRVHSAPDGSFALARATEGVAEIRSFEPGFVTLVPGACAEEKRLGPPESSLVVVAPSADFAGVVLDESDAPVADAKVVFGLREALFRELGLHRRGFEREPAHTRTGADGSFALAGVAGGERVYLHIEAEGFWIATVDLPGTSASDLVIRLERDARGRTVTGIVVDPDGAAVAGARVSAGDAIVTTDEEGRFELAIDRPAGRFGPDARPEPAGEPPELTLAALKVGFRPARERLSDLDLGAPVLLRLGARPESIRGRMLDEQGRARAGIVVWVSDPTPFGREIQSVAEGSTVAWSQTVEDELAGGFGKRGALSDARGGFELGGLLARSYSILAFDPETADLAGPWTITAGSHDVELVLAREARRGRVAGLIVSARGQPLAGVEVHAQRIPQGTDAHVQPPWLRRHSVTTDAEGRFELAELALERTQLVLEDERFLVRTVSLADFEDPERLEIVEPVLCELQVDLSADPALADAVKVLDGEERELATMEFFENGWTMGTEARLHRGLTSVLSVEETAETLVLLRDGLEVLRRPLRLDPAERTTVRP